jgi:flavin-dependent dehydrogenase
VAVLPSCHPADCFDVAIAGAGPGGAAVALRLARAGLRVVAFDRASFPREKACSEYLSPEGVRHLAALGVLEAVEHAGGHPIRGTRVQGPGGSSLTGLFARAGAPFRPTGLSIPRRVLDHVLVEAARGAGAEIRENATVIGLLGNPPGVIGLRVREAHGKTREVAARLVIGADGLHSVTARAIGRRRIGPLRRYALVAHVADVEGLDDTAELHVGPAGYVGLNPLGGGIANLALVLPKSRTGPVSPDPERYLMAALESFPGVRGRVRSGRLVRRVLATGPFAAWTSPVTTGGALLLGDAADFFDPFTGAGIWSALQGAALVEETLLEPLRAGERPGERVLGHYRAARRRAFAGKWAVERLIGYAMLLPALFDRAVDRLERRGLSHTLIGVTGDYLPARTVLNPRFLSQVIL